MIKVSAIVSTYNAERFLRGRLDNLLAQPLYATGQLEIIVVNSGSRQGERYIARDYLGCITYIETLREPIYTAWNRGIAIAKGEYIINANTDDRFLHDALGVMATRLEVRSDIDMVYCDALVTSTENAKDDYVISDKAPYFGRIAWPDHNPALLKQAYYGGPSPMWRRALHAQYGFFDDSFQLAGDYEWALRLAAHGVLFEHIPETLVLFYDDGLNINNAHQAGMEARRAQLRWRGVING